jgi:hypothetical protein
VVTIWGDDKQVIRQARQETLDDVTKLAAAGIIRVIARHQSIAIATTLTQT